MSGVSGFFLGAELMGGDEGGGFKNNTERVMFTFYPVMVLIGLALSLWRKLAGALLIVVGLIGFHVIRPDIGYNPWIDANAVPAILYIIHFFLQKRTLAQH